MRKAAPAFVALVVTPALAQAQLSAEVRAGMSKSLQAALYDRGWNCLSVSDFEIVEPDHYGNVLKVTCASSTLMGEKRSFVYRVTTSQKNARDGKLGDLRVEPWKGGATAN